MVKILSSNSNAPKILLTSSLLRFLGGVVIVLNSICLLWMTAGRAATNEGARGDDVPPSHVDRAPPTNKNGAPIIPFVVSMTNCGEDPFMEGAAVLKYSIHLTSIHGNLGGRYDYKMYAVYHPDATECAKDLASLGFGLIERPVPVKVEEIEGEFLRSRIEKNGCCGAKELIKLEALTFTQYPIVVHLDMDFILLKPLDALFDAMLDETGDLSKYKQSLNVMWPNQTLPKKINAFFTRDYNMVAYSRKIKPVQGGFLVLRPDMKVYREIVDIVKKGDFDKDGGWGGVTRLFYGAMTIQGLFPYYYDVLHPGEAVDLNRCIHNQMADDPRSKDMKDPSKVGKCKTSEEVCEDCRDRPVEDIVSMHFTICLKPWHCMDHHQGGKQHDQCAKMHHQWFGVRSGLEVAWGRSAHGTGNWYSELFYGFCNRYGKKGYTPVSRPFRPTFA